MPFIENSLVKAFTFESFPSQEVVHGIYTRLGGVSPEPWSSLNLGGTVGDERKNVIENRHRIFESIQRPVESIFDTWQIHSSIVLASDRARPLDAPHPHADAILTDKTNVTLMMRFADCVPIFLFDPIRRVVGIVHAGWKGTLALITVNTVRAMAEKYGSNPADILAGIGPSIGPDHYVVGEDVQAQTRSTFGPDSGQLLRTEGGKIFLDLWKANEIGLRRAGVKSIEISGLCTACHTSEWFSHRAEHGKTGRFGAVLALIG
jgi:polyphenol oxidase